MLGSFIDKKKSRMSPKKLHSSGECSRRDPWKILAMYQMFSFIGSQVHEAEFIAALRAFIDFSSSTTCFLFSNCSSQIYVMISSLLYDFSLN